jgi:hypothetical protein
MAWALEILYQNVAFVKLYIVLFFPAQADLNLVSFHGVVTNYLSLFNHMCFCKTAPLFTMQALRGRGGIAPTHS